MSNRTYSRVNAILGDAAVVELVGILGYYTLISMTLNVFRAPLPGDAPLPCPRAGGGNEDYRLFLDSGFLLA